MNSRHSWIRAVTTICLPFAGSAILGLAASVAFADRTLSSSPGIPCTEGEGIFSRLSEEDVGRIILTPSETASWKVLDLSGSVPGARFELEIARSPLWIEMMDAELRTLLLLELPEEVEVPVRVNGLREPPRLEAGAGLPVTGIIECYFEDTRAGESVCYLEAHRFGDAVPEADSVWVLLREMRRRGRISRNKGTLAYTVVAGREFYGMNSSLDDDLAFVEEKREMAMRKFWHRRLEPEFDFGRRNARYLVHAEAHTLMRAFRALGYLPPEMTVFVDRKTCKWCGWGLTNLMETFGVQKLTMVQKGVGDPRVFEVIKK